MQNVIELEQRK